MARVKLPPGFRFHPTDVELVTYYLNRKVHGRAIEFDIVAEVDLYKCEPWDLPDKSLISSSDAEWYFFSARDKKYANGSRTNRATEAGYWKATGKDRTVKTGTRKVGMKKTLVFYKGRAPHGERTNWVMHEYRLEEDEPGKVKLQAVQDAFVVCRVFKKSGIGPKNPDHNSSSLDMEEVDTTTTEDEPVPDERPPASKMQVAAFSLDALTKEKAFMDSEMKTVVDDNAELGVSSKTFNTQEASDIDSMLYAPLLNDPNQSLDFTLVNGSASELARSDTLPTTESSSSPITDQDLELWLQAPDFSGMLDATASISANQVNLADYYSPDEADMLNDLYKSTLQSQEFNVAAHHVGESSLQSKYLVQMSASPKTILEDKYDLSEVDDYVFDDELSSLSEQKPVQEGQAFSSKTLNGSQEASEEAILEEMLQFIEGQQSQVKNAESQEEGATNGLEDVFFDILEELDVDEWMKGNSWNEASTSRLEVKDALEPSNTHFENWFNTSLVSAADLQSVSEELSDLSNSGLSMQTLHSSFQGQGQAELQSGTEDATSSLADLTSTKDHVSYLQDSTPEPSKPLSRFSKLLDSVPALPASAAEYPPNFHKSSFESKDSLMNNPGKSFTQMQTTAWNAGITRITFRCSCEFMSGVWRSSALEGGSKQHILVSNAKAKSSIKAPVYDIEVPKNSDRDGCFMRRGNGCFSLMFFLGALSAVCWFLLLRMAWRLASHMGSLLM
ncbi:hypothetical protein O6H91_Y127800 [Diphasiastrum complanatum]|nr:hypothetical protein O6H91_Y127800 [Diphasiastrum complanatum]KAJ7296377.1 hypothetical protein O6H91_Y127800 [Diphasiastrum complanatum]KAJ7296378.1 hypothetical protein O6H91_Y127800 [Diphasiastrum complanatum]KAJ7296379.1 hypothetical protein O6H91_Y127800 [Diphasiastrum complanatum]